MPIRLWSQLLLHLIPPFKEYLFNTHSGPDTAQNAEDTMYLGLAWRQWFIVSSCHQFSVFWDFPLPCLSNWHMLCNICYVLPSRLCHAFCTITSSPSQQLYSRRHYHLPILQMKKLTQRGKSSVKGGIADTGTQIWSFRGKMPSHREPLKVEWGVLITFISLSAWYCTWYIGHSMNNRRMLNDH